MGSDDRENRSIRVQYLRLFLSVISQAHAVSAQSIRFSSAAKAGQVDFCGPDETAPIVKSLKIKEEYLRPLYELAAERAFQWPDQADLKNSFIPKKARRIAFAPAGNIRFVFDLSPLQNSGDGLSFAFENFQRDKIPDLIEQLDLSEGNKIALGAALKAKAGLIIAGASLKPGAIEAPAALIACRPDAVLISKLDSDEALKEAVQIAESALVIAAIPGDDATQILNDFIGRCQKDSILANKAVERVILSIVQRRVRRTCTGCARPTLIDSLTLDKLPALLRPRDVKSYQFGRGCDRCGHAAYRGTVSIESIMSVDSGIRKLLAENATIDRIVESAYRAGLRSLLEDGLGKIIGGLTSFEEVFAVAPRIGAAFSAAILAVGTTPNPPPAPAAAPPIPATVAPKGSIEDLESDFYLNSTAGKTSARAADHKTTVLVIEDDITQREVLELVFRSAGYEVVGAENGKHGLEVLKSKPVDLVVCDLMMPVMNGEEVVKEIRNDGRLRHLPVLVLTAAGNAETEFNLLSSGADDFCEKNIQRKILLKRAERLLQRSKSRSSGGKNPLEHFLKD